MPTIFGDQSTRSGDKQIKEIVPITDFAILMSEIVPATTRSDSTVDMSSIYVINYADNGGYAIVSTDPRVTEVLCYTDEGNISDNITNPGLKIVLELLPRNIAEQLADYDGEEKTIDIEAAIRSTTKAANQILLKTRWGQGDPFNYYSPKCISENRNMWAGCVATALAQIIAYHKTPQTIRWYYDPTKNPYTDVYFSAVNFELLRNMVYGWDFNEGNQMPWTIVTKLFTMIQYYTDTNFGCYGSGSTDSKAAYCLSNMGYTYNGKPLIKTWSYDFDKIRTDIDANCPVYGSGRQKGISSGHAWVYDGYKTLNGTNYVHCNWGWDGLDNGYYVSGIFKTGVSYEPDVIYDSYPSYEYNTDLRIIYGIRPN